VTTQLNHFFWKVPAYTTVMFPAHAIYRSEGTVLLFDKVGLLVDGNGAVLKATTDGGKAPPTPGRAFKWPRSRASILVENSTNIHLEDLLISGPNDPGGYGSYNPALEAQAGVDIEGSTDVVVANSTIRHVFGDYVYISGTSQHVQVLGNTLTANGRQGVSVTNARYVLIENNTMYGVGRSAIDLEPDTRAGVADDVDVYDNTIVGVVLDFVAAEGAGTHVDYVNVVGNKLIDTALTIKVRAADGSARHDWAVIDNSTDVVEGSPIAPIEFYYVDNVRVEGNYEAMASDQPSVAVYLVHPCTWELADNHFPGAEATEPQGIASQCAWRSDAIQPSG